MKALKDATRLGNIELKNRFIRAAVDDPTNEGHISEANISLYRRLAQGGAAALITGFTIVDEAESKANQFSLASDDLVEEYRQVADVIHENGSKGIVQLVYLGGFTPQERPLGPSVMKNPYTGVESVEMTLEDIAQMKQKFVRAAVRAKEVGFDGVEIHAAHGFLHHQFFSAAMNQRTDQYGGSVENRSRFIIETYEAMRQAVGNDFALMAKINVEGEGDDYLYLAQELDRRGIDAIETSGHWINHKAKERMYYARANKELKAVVNCPVIQTGGNRDFADLEKALNETGVDYIGLARPLISEPDLVNKYLRGEITKMRCIGCNGCLRTPGFTCVLNNKKA